MPGRAAGTPLSFFRRSSGGSSRSSEQSHPTQGGLRLPTSRQSPPPAVTASSGRRLQRLSDFRNALRRRRPPLPGVAEAASPDSISETAESNVSTVAAEGQSTGGTPSVDYGDYCVYLLSLPHQRDNHPANDELPSERPSKSNDEHLTYEQAITTAVKGYVSEQRFLRHDHDISSAAPDLGWTGFARAVTALTSRFPDNEDFRSAQELVSAFQLSCYTPSAESLINDDSDFVRPCIGSLLRARSALGSERGDFETQHVPADSLRKPPEHPRDGLQGAREWV